MTNNPMHGSRRAKVQSKIEANRKALPRARC